jgi:hypothetical protein
MLIFDFFYILFYTFLKSHRFWMDSFIKYFLCTNNISRITLIAILLLYYCNFFFGFFLFEDFFSGIRGHFRMVRLRILISIPYLGVIEHKYCKG